MPDLQTLLSKFLTDLYAGQIGLPLGAGTVFLVGDAANVIGQRNGTNAQTFRIYNTSANGNVDFERASLGWAANTFSVKTEAGGTGGVRDINIISGASALLDLGAGATARWRINSSGHLLAIADNTYDIGATGATRPRNVFIAGTISQLGSITTAGSFGTPPITAVSEATGLTAADTNRINYTPAAASSTYRISGVVNVTAWATPASFTVAITYKDASGNARTDTALVIRGSTGASAAAVTAVDRWYYTFPAVDIDNSATAITVSTTGTFTGTPVYNHAAVLERIR